MTYLCVCTYCNADWLESFSDGSDPRDCCQCKICGDTKVQIKTYKEEVNNPFGYEPDFLSDADDWSLM